MFFALITAFLICCKNKQVRKSIESGLKSAQTNLSDGLLVGISPLKEATVASQNFFVSVESHLVKFNWLV